MANKNCTACNELKDYAPNFATNGVTDAECNSLKNDTGLNPELTKKHTDCDDLNDANDCLVGNMEDELEYYDACDWKDYMKGLVPNIYNLFKAIICAICGLWTNVHKLWNEIEKLWTEINQINTKITNLQAEDKSIRAAIKSLQSASENQQTQLKAASYSGIYTLYTTKQVKWSGSTEARVKQTPAFNANTQQGNMPKGTFSTSDHKSIMVTNTTSVPILVDCTFNSSIYSSQRLCGCWISVMRDGICVGQTPFIAPDTYDQQVSAEPFVLKPGTSAKMSYYFCVGKSNEWFANNLTKSGLEAGDCRCVLDPDEKTATNQRSYFFVKVTSMVENVES